MERRRGVIIDGGPSLLQLKEGAHALQRRQWHLPRDEGNDVAQLLAQATEGAMEEVLVGHCLAQLAKGQ